MKRWSDLLNPWSIAGLLIPLVLWEIGAHVLLAVYPLGSFLLPTIESIILHSLPGFATFDTSTAQGFGGASSYLGAFRVLAEHSVATLTRVGLGTISGLVLGILVGLLIGWSKSLRDFLFPIIQILRTIPFLALIVLFLLWFGGAEIGPLVYISFVVFTTMVIITMEAIRNVPPVYRHFAQTLGANDLQIYRTVVVPAITPSLVGAIRVVLGSAWAIVLAAEYLAVQTGLGRLMILSEMFFETGRIVVVVLLFMAFSAATNYMFLAGARRLTRWQPDN
ncbi:MAG: ABC transporter permease [Chloroflexota bacterium]